MTTLMRTLSRGLRDLEYQLESGLFERTNGGTRPTVAGIRFAENKSSAQIENSPA
jgi:DNA-binding transcriptional LysR family regulator